MKQLCYQKWMQILSRILCILSFNIMVASFICFGLMESNDIYTKEKTEVQEEFFENALRAYSICAMADYQDDFGMEQLSKTNFRYGVIQADSIEGLDFNDKSIYEVCNFDKKVTEDMLHIYSCDMGEETNCRAGKSIFDNFYIYNEQGVVQEVSYPIEACYYVRNTRDLYYLANGKLYQQLGEDFFLSEDMQPIDLSKEIVKEGAAEESGYVWQDPNKQIVVCDMNYYLSDIQIVTLQELKAVGMIMPSDSGQTDYAEYNVNNGALTTYTYGFVKTKPYYVLSYVNEPLDVKEGYWNEGILKQFFTWDEQDFFIQLSFFINLAYSMRQFIYIAIFLGIILFFVTLEMVMTGAGHEKGYDGIKEDWFDKIPYDIYTSAVIGIVSFLLMMSAYGVMELTSRFALVSGFFMVLGSEWISLRYLESTAVRIKKGKWWRNTLIYLLLRWCKKTTGKILCQTKQFLKKATGAVPFLWKAWIVMGILALLELMGIAAAGYRPDEQVVLWLIEKVIVYGVISICLLQLDCLRQGAKKIADGKTDSRIDTTKMFWDFKEHGENLNRIQEGIGKAVGERMKSERLKTELITNVSHDIKTPLTSIINYVDLLEKEEIDNRKVQEYLEVLSRQSVRLKKLIEDLMEASKASTGNLAVHYERCDAGVMLTQTVGEFEEKLKAGQIELLVKNSDVPVCIQADPRHLWRIFENLMNNICKYAQPETRAYVNIEKDDMSGRIIFRNISKYALNIDSDELMERFVRGDSSRNTEGSGLGLSIAKSLTELMYGTLELVVDGDLFKVIITFPLTD